MRLLSKRLVDPETGQSWIVLHKPSQYGWDVPLAVLSPEDAVILAASLAQAMQVPQETQ